MSAKHVRSISDFARFRKDVEVACSCGHTTVLPYRHVVSAFVANCWPKGLGSALKHFRCLKCGSRPDRIGPRMR